MLRLQALPHVSLLRASALPLLLNIHSATAYDIRFNHTHILLPWISNTII